ncbi:MAG: HlyD family efflux transporter periplasmic adaptor subunit [Actinomycetota bacterium]
MTPLWELRKSRSLPQLVGVSSLLITGIATLSIAAMLAWVLLGTVEEQVEGTGLLIREPGLTAVDAPNDGIVVDVTRTVDDVVVAGAPLFSLKTPSGSTVVVQAPASGVVSVVTTTVGSVVQLGDRLATLSPATGPIAATVFVDALEAVDVEPGMEAIVWPFGTSPAEEGAAVGVVTSIATFPATFAQLEAALQSGPLVASLSRSPVVEVTISLGDERTLDWTLADPAAAKARPGSVVRANVTISSQRPIDAILGAR